MVLLDLHVLKSAEAAELGPEFVPLSLLSVLISEADE